MKRTTLNLIIDLLGAALFLGMLASGYILYFALPPGTNKSLWLWGLTRHEWGRMHFWISLGLVSVLLVHLALHWQWVFATVARRLGRTTSPHDRHVRSAVTTLLIVGTVLGLFAWVTKVSVRERDGPYGSTDGSPVTGGLVPSTESGSRIDFRADVYPILESACHRCHGSDIARAGFRVDRREDYFARGADTALVIAGDSAKSPLIEIVSGYRPDMPMASSHRLPAQDVAVLRAWIDAGAAWPERLQPP